MLTNHVVPRSTAKNLYDLLDDFCEVVTLQPKRVYMPSVVHSFKDAAVEVTEFNTPVKGPECGTIGCIAGWLKIMTRTKEWTGVEKFRITGMPRRVLDEVQHWFSGASYDPNSLQWKATRLFTTDFPDAEYGTRAYGRHVVRNVRQFMKDNKVELKALSVVR